MPLAELRREYNLGGLRRSDLAAGPIEQFKRWFDQATGARASGRIRKFFIGVYKSLLMVTGTEPTELNAMTLATADGQGRPSARVVLLKGVDERGFIFFTNYESRKGEQLTANPHAALVFYWADQERQVCVTGPVSKLPVQESEAYFKTRPRGSQVGAWASRQSSVARDRAELESRWAEIEKRFHSQEVPLPPYWGGFVLSPTQMEFWQGRPNRLHDRFRYTKSADGWAIERLSP
jgi:pyridoxamine 5'-phosphate oxidase